MTLARASGDTGEFRPGADGMSENSSKNKAKKPTQTGVLGSLPATRPARVGRARTDAAKPARPKAKPAAEKAPAAAKSAQPKAPPPPKSARQKSPPAEPPPRHDGPPRGADLAVTAARAVGELAQIGATVGTQVLKRAAKRLPRR
jgi:hypothetical protein